jgi:hypothetical protein
VFGPRAEIRPAWKPSTSLQPTVGLRRAFRTGSDPSRTSVETLGAPSTAPSSEELDPALQNRLRAPKSSSARPHGLASTPPWKRLTTPGHQPGSEELDLKLPTPSGAPRSTIERRRETAPRLRGNALQPLTFSRAPKNPTSSCRLAPARRRAPRPVNARSRRASVETIDDPWPSAGLRRARPQAADTLRRSEEHHRASTRDRVTPPWKRSTTPGSRTGSEEPDPELPARSSAPRSTVTRRRETASRLRERPSAHADHLPRPEGRVFQSMNATGPSRDLSTHLWRVSPVRRPPRHPAGLLPSPRTFPQTPRHIDTPKGASVKEANTSRPCGPVNRHRTWQATPKGSSSDPQPVSRPMELTSADLSSRYAAPKSDTAILELSHELRGSAHTKRCTAVGLQKAFRRRATPRSRAQSARLTALVTPHDPEGTLDESAATDWPLRRRCAGRAGRLEAPKSLLAGRSRT